MRPSRLYQKKKTKRKPASVKSFRQYRRTAVAEYKLAVERVFGSQGAASSVRRIDPKTGKVLEVFDPN
jgi:hypothetical protein